MAVGLNQGVARVNYYQHHIGDYRRDTMHLSLLEHGCYRALLDMYYLSEDPIPLETQSVFRRLCARTQEEQDAVEMVLKEFFQRTEMGWVQARCEVELDEYKRKAGVARSNGKLGGRPKKTQPVISGNPEQTQEKANHKPLTINQEPIKTNTAGKPPTFSARSHLEKLGVTEPTLTDWLTLRKTKRAAVTETAITGIQREAEKAGLSLQDALRTCCERDWRGFKAEWLTVQPRASPNQSVQQQRANFMERLTGGANADHRIERDITVTATRIA